MVEDNFSSVTPRTMVCGSVLFGDDSGRNLIVLGVRPWRKLHGKTKFVIRKRPGRERQALTMRPDCQKKKLENDKLNFQTSLLNFRAFGAGYLAIAPKVMCAGGHEKVFLTFTNFTQPVDVQFAVLDKNDESVGTSKLETFSTPCGCLDVHVSSRLQM